MPSRTFSSTDLPKSQLGDHSEFASRYTNVHFYTYIFIISCRRCKFQKNSNFELRHSQ